MEKQLSNSVAKTLCIERMKSLMDSRQSLFKEALPHKALFEPYQKLGECFAGNDRSRSGVFSVNQK